MVGHMKKCGIWVSILLLFAGCAKSTDKAAFHAEWDFLSENVVTSNSETAQVSVTTRPPQFKITTKAPGSTKVEVYDGESIYRLMTFYPQVDSMGGQTSDPAYIAEPSRSSLPMNPDQAAAMRFWVQPISGISKSGGLIAGRDTLLYETKLKRNDGEFSSQKWVDAETGVLLKSVETIYSSQINSIVTRESRECKSIEYTTPDDAVFGRP
jgi:hypothetical protein